MAVDPCWVIGAEGEIPWRLPEDLRRFKALTLGGALVMGRRTHESIGRALPGRRNIVLSTRPAFEPRPPALLARTLSEALELAGSVPVWIIGGASLYEETLPGLEELHVTVVHRVFSGNVHFPPLSEQGWEVVFKEAHPEATLPHTFLTLRPSGHGPLLDASQTEVPGSWGP